ncbi:hypothetical protein [Pararhodobacter zhoushanensis]|uniref:hypothetical protein n=1 Tax=Pararhodobacter zhoushanensis TaxID=2479545 RepID=UPI000F8EA260|nr:hypothetical protein [Pararhodobacter zhoushanensis]
MGGRVLSPLLRLAARTPLGQPVALAVLALALARTPPIPINGGPGVTLAPWLLALATALALWRLRHAPSMARALTSGQTRTATVTDAPGPRLTWTDTTDTQGHSLRRQPDDWRPPAGHRITLLADPRTGKAWWEGDLPGDLLAADLPHHPDAPQIPWSRLVENPFAWLTGAFALFALLLTLALQRGDGPLLGWMILGLLGLTAWTAPKAADDIMAMNRAARRGVRLSAKVTGHTATGNSRHHQMLWTTKQGHSGETRPNQGKLPKPGASIRVYIDPITRRGFWSGDYPT